ncbi:MAG: glycosyltransferase family 4 protein [Candidatus Magasanikbacteria bacterium]|nr:glycosyltransferase family 4 protein [Candidatus Magasanikbacteria bacterium]
MKIGIDARMLGSGFGLARYTQQLVQHLLEVETTHTYVLFLRKDNWDEVLPHKRIKKVLADIPWYSVAEQVQLPKLLNKEKLDLMHFPHWNVPLFYTGKFVVTIHDLIMYHFPRPEATTLGPVKFFIKDKIHRIVLRNAVKKAKHILVTSEFTKHDVVKHLGVKEEKMTTTYQAPFTLEEEQVGRDAKQVLEKYHISKPYVIYVGAAYPHKNLDRLVDAWQVFQETHGNTHQLVLVGKENYFYTKLQEKINSLNSVVYTGFVPDQELVALYKKAKLYVFPSLYEGFGIPPLEAMQYGIPVVSSSATCLPEVLGGAAIYVDPLHIEGMAEAIHRGLDDIDARHAVKEEAKILLQKYSWSKLACETVRVYER